METILSPSIINKLKLSEKCPEYAKKMNVSDRYIILKLLEQYCKRFDWCLNGANYPYANIEVEDSMMKNLKEIFSEAFGKCEKSKTFMNKLDKNKREYDNRKKFTKYTWILDKKDAINFFSIFDENIIQPKVEKAWVHLTKQKKIFRSLKDEEIKKVYHQKDQSVSSDTQRNIEKEFLVGLNDEAFCTWRHISVLFGNSRSRHLLYHMRLEYFKNVNPISETGLLKLNFTYQTFLNGLALGILPSDKRKIEEEEKLMEKRKKQNINQAVVVENKPLLDLDLNKPEDRHFWELVQKLDEYDN